MAEKLVALLKIGKKEFQHHIYDDGQFYMTPSKYFYTKAQEDKDSMVFDLHESSFPRNTVFTIGEESLTPFDVEDDYSTAINLGINTCIFCCYAIMENQVKTEAGKTYFTVPKELIKSFVGEQPPRDFEIIVLKTPSDILQRIVSCATNLNLPIAVNRVCYDDHDFDCSLSLLSEDINKFALELCFHKCKKYASQNEFRIAIVNSLDAAREDIKIGQLSSVEYSKFEIISLETDIRILF